MIFFWLVIILNFCCREERILLRGKVVFWGFKMLDFSLVIFNNMERSVCVLFREFIMFLDKLVNLFFLVFLFSIVVNKLVVLKGCIRLCFVVVKNLVLFLFVFIVFCFVVFSFKVCCIILVFKLFFVFFRVFWIEMYLVMLLKVVI